MKVFISHIHQEASLAKALKTSIESCFPGECTVFESSDPQDLAPGDRWLDKIKKALQKVDVLLVLCSPLSVDQPWINFEAGCVWWLKSTTSVIPICHDGLTKDRLRTPLSEFQALEISDSSFVNSLMTAISKHAPESDREPIDEHAIWDELAKVVWELRQEKRTVEVQVDFPGREGTITFLAVPKANLIEEVARRTGLDLAKYSVQWHLTDANDRPVADGLVSGFRATFYGSKTRLVLKKGPAVKKRR